MNRFLYRFITAVLLAPLIILLPASEHLFKGAMMSQELMSFQSLTQVASVPD